jgi:hypothetical protein
MNDIDMWDDIEEAFEVGDMKEYKRLMSIFIQQYIEDNYE